MTKVNPRVVHASVTGAAANPAVLVDGPKWDADHAITGFSNLDDTADADKPISTATQTALNNLLVAGTNTITGGTAQGILYKTAGGLLDTSTVVLNATYSGYPFLLLGNQPTVLTDISFTGSRPPAVVVGQNLSHNNIIYNSFLDVTTITPTNANALFCSYAASVRTANTAFNIGHVCWGEDFFIHNGSGTITDIWTLSSAPTINTGTVTTRKAFTVSDFSGAGAIGTQYGLYIAALTKATTNWGVYIVGATPSYFGGNILIGTAGTPASVTAPLTINKNATAAPTRNSANTVFQATNVDGSGTHIELRSYVNGNTTNPALLTYAANGTLAAPSALTTGNALFAIAGAAYGASTFGTFDYVVQVEALEPITNSAKGNALDIYTTSIGAASIAKRLRIAQGLVVGSSGTDMGSGTVNVSSAYYVNGVNILAGTTTNDDAAAGRIGEYRFSKNSGTSTVTISNASPGVITWASHPLNIGSAVNFTTTGGLPTGLTVGTNYFVSSQGFAAGSFSVSTSLANALAGTSVNTSSAGSGTHTATSTVILTDVTQTTITGISLTAGDWDINSLISFNAGTGTTITSGILSLSTTNAALDTTIDRLTAVTIPSSGFTLPNGASVFLGIGPTRFSLSATTTVHMIARAAFGASTLSASGIIRARRVR